MPKHETFDGVDLVLTGDQEMTFDYAPSDVAEAYRRGDPNREWRSWDQMIGWLERHGAHQQRLTPGEAVAMVEDFRTLRASNAPYTSNPEQAYQEAHRHRTANDQQHDQLHQRIREAARTAHTAHDH